MTRVHATSSCVQSDSIKGLAQSIAQPAYNRLLIAEPLLRRAVPTLIIAFLVTILIGAFVQVLDQNRQKHAATTREIASLADLMKERIDHLAARRPDRALNATRLAAAPPRNFNIDDFIGLIGLTAEANKQVCWLENT